MANGWRPCETVQSARAGILFLRVGYRRQGSKRAVKEARRNETGAHAG